MGRMDRIRIIEIGGSRSLSPRPPFPLKRARGRKPVGWDDSRFSIGFTLWLLILNPFGVFPPFGKGGHRGDIGCYQFPKFAVHFKQDGQDNQDKKNG
jgi:hypothetical protein